MKLFIVADSNDGPTERSSILILIALFGVALAGLAIAAANNVLPFQQLGKSMREQVEVSDDTRVIAQYGEYTFTEKDVNVRLEMNRATGGEMAKKDTVEAAVEQLAIGKMMLEEADKLGLTATKEEIEQFLTEQKNTYKEDVAVKSYLDEYCAGAGMTIEDYWTLLEATAPETVTRQKLKGKMIEDYCEDHPDASNEEVTTAWNAYEQALLDQHRSEIAYIGN